MESGQVLLHDAAHDEDHVWVEGEGKAVGDARRKLDVENGPDLQLRVVALYAVREFVFGHVQTAEQVDVLGPAGAGTSIDPRTVYRLDAFPAVSLH